MESKNILTALDNIAEAINNGGSGSSGNGGSNSESSASNDIVFPLYIAQVSTGGEEGYITIDENGNEISLLFDEILNAFRSNKIIRAALLITKDNERQTLSSLNAEYQIDVDTGSQYFYIFFNNWSTDWVDFTPLRCYPDSNGKLIVEKAPDAST